MPKKRQATLTHDGPEDQTAILLADFDQLTLTLTQIGGYQSRPTGPTSTSFTPAAADAFWKQLESLAAKGLRGDDDEPRQKYGNWPDPVPPASYADIAALFALLKS